MSAEFLFRTVGADENIQEGIKSGIYSVFGGVVRKAKGQDGAGQIFAHLKYPDGAEKASEQLSKMMASENAISAGMQSLQALQAANLVLSGLNLAVSVAGFYIVCKKLDGISQKIDCQSEKLDQLIALTLLDRQKEGFRDMARFRSLIQTAQQFTESNDIEHLKPLIMEFREQYEFTRLILAKSACDFTLAQSYKSSIAELRLLQERLLHLGLFLAFVQQKIGAFKYAEEALNNLRKDWLNINNTIISVVKNDASYIENLTKSESEEILAMLDYRKTVDPALEYQASLIHFMANKPELQLELDVSNEEALILAA